jgi:hypothetical protein
MSVPHLNFSISILPLSRQYLTRAARVRLAHEEFGMKKLVLLAALLGLGYFAHSKGWLTVNAEKAKADLHELMDTAFARGNEIQEKLRGHKDCEKNKELNESKRDTLVKEPLRE